MEKMKEETGTYAKRKRNLNSLMQHYQNVAARNFLNALDNFKTEDWTMSINEATPQDWDRLRKDIPAIESNAIDNAMVDYHAFLNQQYITDTTRIHPAVEDVVNNPSHYNTGNIECIEAIEESMPPEAYKGYLKGNCMKYLWRYDYKGKPVEDLEKAAWYLNKLIEVQEAEDE